MIISKYICLFLVYSCLGWMYETVYCTILTGKWENRGFLYGPVCPIYGVGAVVISLIAGAAECLQSWQLFLISVFGSAVLEYFTSLFLEKMFHATWWDYSNMPLNLHGRISLITSLCFGCAGLLIVYIIAPFTERTVSLIHPLALESLALLSVAVFMVDLTLTVTALMHFDQMVIQIEQGINRNMEHLVENTVQRTGQIRQNLIARQRNLNERINLMQSYAKSAILRIRTFKYDDKSRTSAVNRLLLIVKRNRKK